MSGSTDGTKTIILAGGAGERLRPLTLNRAKPAVPFGGKYRIIDFILSNCLHSELRKIYVIPQYEPLSLIDHLDSWRDIFNTEMNECLKSLSPRTRAAQDLTPYVGTADAVFQNIRYLLHRKPDRVLILAGDQVYKMDYRELIDFHHKKKAELTIGVAETDLEVAQRSGVVKIGSNQRVIKFKEKSDNPEPLPQNPDRFLVSMSVYVFDPEVLIEELEKDSQDAESSHDFGKNILPKMHQEGRKIFAFPLTDEETRKPGYWRDVGTIDSYYQANMELCSMTPEFNLYDKEWFWRTPSQPLPPAKTVFRLEERESIICSGCIIDDAGIYHSILSSGARVGRGVVISDSIIMNDVTVENDVKITKAIVDKRNVISAGSVIEAGNMRYEGEYEVTPSGIVVIGHHEEPWSGD